MPPSPIELIQLSVYLLLPCVVSPIFHTSPASIYTNVKVFTHVGYCSFSHFNLRPSGTPNSFFFTIYSSKLNGPYTSEVSMLRIQ